MQFFTGYFDIIVVHFYHTCYNFAKCIVSMKHIFGVCEKYLLEFLMS